MDESTLQASQDSSDADRGPLRIAMVAPPWFELPPVGYGGIEVVVADLVDGLVDAGHEVTLIGAGTHRTRAQHFVATFPEPPGGRLGEGVPDVLHAALVAQILDRGGFDVVHDHSLAGPLLARGTIAPTVITTHGPLDGEFGRYYRALAPAVRFVAISDAQRRAAADLPWLATVHNGIRVGSFPFQEQKEDFALFLGRFHPQKAPHLAVDAARAAGLPIVLAGKCIEPVEKQYFAEHIEPRLGPDVTMFGPADADAKRDLLARAACLLFPITWEEPFGLVMTEAMACGTPVVALRRGSVPEVVWDGVTGITVTHPTDLPAAIAAARELDPAACRRHVQDNFATDVMATRYEHAYRRLLGELHEPSTPTHHAQADRGPAPIGLVPTADLDVACA